MAMKHAALAEVCRRDPRFAYEAYEFLFDALKHTQRMLGLAPKKGKPKEQVQQHVGGRALLDGVRDLALREFGLMARTVFHCWGIRKSADFGDIVFNLVDAELLSKTDADNRGDFVDVFDLQDDLMQQYEIKLEERE